MNNTQNASSFIRYHFGNFSSLFHFVLIFHCQKKRGKFLEFLCILDNYIRFMLMFTARYPFSRSFSMQMSANFRKFPGFNNFFTNFLSLNFLKTSEQISVHVVSVAYKLWLAQCCAVWVSERRKCEICQSFKTLTDR